MGAAARGALGELLAEHVGAKPSAVSQHPVMLRRGRLVRTRREGTHVFYLAEKDQVRRIVEEGLLHADHVVRGLADHDEQPSAPTTVTRKPA